MDGTKKGKKRELVEDIDVDGTLPISVYSLIFFHA